MSKFIEPRIAFEVGKSAKKRGFSRTSPYYEDEKADHFFFAGYDGKTPEEMGLTLTVVSGGMATPTETPGTSSSSLVDTSQLEVVQK